MGLKMLCQEEIRRLKLLAALDAAPRPTAKPDAEWMVAYMDWFFQTRVNALGAFSSTPTSVLGDKNK
jgi:hypothetical protein